MPLPVNSAPLHASRSLESEYTPFQAGTIAAGAATSAAIQQLARLGLLGIGAVADRHGFKDQASWSRQRAEQLRQEMDSHSLLYQPLRAAFPFSTSIGEATPSVIGGMGALRSAEMFAGAREGFGALARLSGSPGLLSAYQGLRF